MILVEIWCFFLPLSFKGIGFAEITLELARTRPLGRCGFAASSGGYHRKTRPKSWFLCYLCKNHQSNLNSTEKCPNQKTPTGNLRWIPPFWVITENLTLFPPFDFLTWKPFEKLLLDTWFPFKSPYFSIGWILSIISWKNSKFLIFLFVVFR